MSARGTDFGGEAARALVGSISSDVNGAIVESDCTRRCTRWFGMLSTTGE